jgi:ferredoxin
VRRHLSVNALSKRPDGIVDIDRDACIGCRACMQACPYDALYLNENHGAVEKCHYCAHRVEKGLEPACVIVCPEQAIISGDLNDPRSRISQMVRDGQTLLRRTEQGTGPNVHYKGVEAAALDPGAPERPSMYLWSDRPPQKKESWPISLASVEEHARGARCGAPCGVGLAGGAVPGHQGNRRRGGDAGALRLEAGPDRVRRAVRPGALAIIFTAATAGLLIEDLKRPSLFYRLLTRPNWKSWLVKGGIILGAFGGCSTLVVLLAMLGMDGAAQSLRWAEAVLGLAAAGYTAFLFAQCKGRDLWESKLLLPHLLVQAAACGGAALAPFATERWRLGWIIVVGVLAHAAIAAYERFTRHATTNANQAAAFLGTVRLGPFQPCGMG